MCTVSMIMDHYRDKWSPYCPSITAPSIPNWIGTGYAPADPIHSPPPLPRITDAEISEFRRLLERAREYDKRNNEPNCEMASKKKAIKDLAAELGMDVSFVDEASSEA